MLYRKWFRGDELLIFFGKYTDKNVIDYIWLVVFDGRGIKTVFAICKKQK